MDEAKVSSAQLQPCRFVCALRQPRTDLLGGDAVRVGLEQPLEDIEHLRFKLRMFGIPLYEDEEGNNATYIFCDNESLVKNSTNVESSLNKKHSSVAYHFARWNVAAGVCKIAWIPTGRNIADALTKRLPERKREELYGDWTY